MKVLIADKFEAGGVDALRRIGCDVVHDPGLQDAALREAIVKTGCAVLIVRSTKVNAAALRAGDDLALVVRAGAGYNTIDVSAASAASILVANCPGKNAVAVAELTFALILSLDRRVVENTDALRAGQWNKKEFSEARGLKGRTLGIVGLGRIGQAVARRARGFEMPVVAWSRSLTNESAERLHVAPCESAADVASRCDVLSIHLASTPDTKDLVNRAVLERLKPGSYVINTSRADVLDYAALADEVKQREIRVGLDVYPDEPSSGVAPFSPPIFETGGVVCGTHHIGASTAQAQQAIGEETVRIVKSYLETGQVIHCVNLREGSAATWCLSVRHLNKPGVLAGVLEALSHERINVEEMHNVILAGGDAARAQIHLDAKPADQVLERIRSQSDSVLGVDLTHGNQD